MRETWWAITIGSQCINKKRAMTEEILRGRTVEGGAVSRRTPRRDRSFCDMQMAASKSVHFLSAWESVLKQWAITSSLSCLPSGASIHSGVGARYWAAARTTAEGRGQAGPSQAYSARQHDTWLIRAWRGLIFRGFSSQCSSTTLPQQHFEWRCSI